MRDGGTYPSEVVGHRLSHRPPDVHRSLAQPARLRGPSLGSLASVGTLVRATLLTFGATLPGTYRLHRSRRSPGGTASPGIVQRSPLRRPASTGVHSQLLPRGRTLRSQRATANPCSVLVVSHHLDGFLLRYRARVLQRAPDPGVHPVFRPPARQVASADRCVLPRDVSLPFEAFPPSVASAASPACCHAVHRAPCLLTLSLPLPRPTRTVARARLSQVGAVGPRGLPPRTGPLQDRRLPVGRARCSPGLCPAPPPRRSREREPRDDAPGERQRPLPDPRDHVAVTT